MDTIITVAGNLTADPVQRMTASGATVVSLRVASSARRFDREAMEWRDGDPMFINVSCWRQLAGNVHATLRKGDSVVIHGRLSMRTFDDRAGNTRTAYEIEAVAIGPDLTRCPAELRRPQRATSALEPAPEPPAAAPAPAQGATPSDRESTTPTQAAETTDTEASRPATAA